MVYVFFFVFFNNLLAGNGIHPEPTSRWIHLLSHHELFSGKVRRGKQQSGFWGKVGLDTELVCPAPEGDGHPFDAIVRNLHPQANQDQIRLYAQKQSLWSCPWSFVFQVTHQAKLDREACLARCKKWSRKWITRKWHEMETRNWQVMKQQRGTLSESAARTEKFRVHSSSTSGPSSI